jgi:hypothetical protein
MAASINDKITKASSGSRPSATTLTATRAVSASSISCGALTGWPTDTAVHFIIYTVDVNGNKVAGSQTDWKGVVSGTTITNLVLRAGTDSGNSIGAIVEASPTAAWADDTATQILVEHNQDGTHKISQLVDTNGNELLKLSQVSSAVNELTINNAATGNPPSLEATGGDTNIDVKLTPKGTGVLKIGSRSVAIGAWTSYTPTWTNFTTGNGVLTHALYTQIGNLGIVRLKFTLGTTSSASGSVKFSLPFTTANYGAVFQDIGGGIFWDNSATTLYNLKTVWESTTTAAVMVTGTGGTYGTLNYLDNTIPVTPATSDYIQCWLMVELA